MNLQFLLSLIKGKNVFETVSKVLVLVAGFLAGIDADKEGNDDLAAGALLAVADATAAYGEQDNNEHGNIVDGLIAGLQRYRAEMVQCGRITTVPKPS
jgi:hypothetical protein